VIDGDRLLTPSLDRASTSPTNQEGDMITNPNIAQLLASQRIAELRAEADARRLTSGSSSKQARRTRRAWRRRARLILITGADR
jgi:hypothetical protein